MDRDFKGVWIPKEIWLNEELTWTEKGLIVEIESLSKNGECFASNSHFAKFLGVSKDRVSKMITELRRKGFIKIELIYKKDSKEIEKRIITPIGADTYTPRQTNLDPRGTETYTPIGENAYDNNTVINNTINNPISNKKEQKRHPIKAYEEEFETLWKQYPRKKGKEKAKASYIKFRKKDEGMYERVQTGIKQYKKYIEVHAIGEEFIKHGSTWFGNASWSDEYNLKRENQRQGFYGLWLNEIDRQNENIIEYEEGAFYDTRGSLETINDYPNFLP